MQKIFFHSTIVGLVVTALCGCPGSPVSRALHKAIAGSEGKVLIYEEESPYSSNSAQLRKAVSMSKFSSVEPGPVFARYGGKAEDQLLAICRDMDIDYVISISNIQTTRPRVVYQDKSEIISAAGFSGVVKAYETMHGTLLLKKDVAISARGRVGNVDLIRNRSRSQLRSQSLQDAANNAPVLFVYTILDELRQAPKPSSLFPELHITITIDDSLGNDNGLLELGEKARFLVEVKNSGEGTAYEVQVTSATDERQISLTVHEKSIDLMPGEISDFNIVAGALIKRVDPSVPILFQAKERYGHGVEKIVTLEQIERAESLNRMIERLVNNLHGSFEGNTNVVGVLPFQANTHASGEFTKYLLDEIMARFSRLEGVTIVEKDRIEQVIRELALHMTGLIAPEQCKDMGRLLKADVLVTGMVENKQEVVNVYASALSTRTGYPIEKKEEVVEKNDLVCRLFGEEKARFVGDQRVKVRELAKLLGMSVRATHQGPNRFDFVVYSVGIHTAAHKAGFEVGDVIVEINGSPLETLADYESLHESIGQKKQIIFRVKRQEVLQYLIVYVPE